MNDLRLDIDEGTYVIALSGGVDSVVLLDLLTKKPGIKLIVAHFDHGIRPNSSEDRLLAQKIAKNYRLPFVFDKANLGPGTSEAKARKARYAFLKSVKEASGAKAIITAHQQDDIIETAILNMLRGTKRKGISSLRSTDDMVRPITHIEKNNLYSYAKQNNLVWHEDITNKNTNYRRNYIRHRIVPRFNNRQRQQFLDIIKKSATLNDQIDEDVKQYLLAWSNVNTINRNSFIILPHSVSLEVMASWLRQNNVRDFDSKLLELLTIGAKTLKSGQRIDVNIEYILEIKKDRLALIKREC